MKQSKSTKRALLTSVLAMLLCLTMLVGSTFAWFTDSVSTGVNKIVAGNLDVELERATFNDDGTFKEWAPVQGESLFDEATLWEPGHTEVVYLKVTNMGTLALKYQFAVTVEDFVDGTSVNGDKIHLADHLVFGQAADYNVELSGPYANRAAAQAAAGEKKGLENYTVEKELLPGEEGVDYIALVVYMPTSVGNEANYRGEEIPQITLGIELVAKQFTSESDSFGHDYDEKAEYPVSSVEELKDAIASAEDGDVIALTEDMALTEGLTVDKAITIDGNGKTISGKPITATADVEIKNVTLSKADNAKKNATLVYAQAGCENLTFDGVTFSDPQWEAIQITSNDLKTLTINNCTFTAANVEGAASGTYGDAADEAVRFIHYEATGSAKPVIDFTITNNKFQNCDKVIAPIGIFYIGEGSTLHVCGNTFEGTLKNQPIFGWPAMTELQNTAAWGVAELTTYTYSK